jgi:hypothetical protein
VIILWERGGEEGADSIDYRLPFGRMEQEGTKEEADVEEEGHADEEEVEEEDE